MVYEDTLTSLEGRNIFLNTWLGFLYMMGLINSKVFKKNFLKIGKILLHSLFLKKELQVIVLILGLGIFSLPTFPNNITPDPSTLSEPEN